LMTWPRLCMAPPCSRRSRCRWPSPLQGQRSKQLELPCNPVKLFLGPWAYSQARDRPWLELCEPPVLNQGRWELGGLSLLVKLTESLLCLDLQNDLGLASLFPLAEPIRPPVHGLLRGRERSVRDLGSNFPLPHLQIGPHDDHLFHP